MGSDCGPTVAWAPRDHGTTTKAIGCKFLSLGWGRATIFTYFSHINLDSTILLQLSAASLAEKFNTQYGHVVNILHFKEVSNGNGNRMRHESVPDLDPPFPSPFFKMHP